MRVLVTGATGCLGGALVRKLTHESIHVTASGRNRKLGDRLVEEGIVFRAADIRDRAKVMDLVSGHDTIVHCGGLSSVWGLSSDFHAANVEGTRSLLLAAQKHAVRRFIFVSTPSLYFDFTDRFDVREGDPLARHPVNAYAASKLAAEELVRMAGDKGMQVVVVRPRAIFGPQDNSLLPRLLRVAQRGWLPLIDDGRAIVDLTYVDNVCDALLTAVRTASDLSGGIFNITNGKSISIRELMQCIVDLFGLKVRFLSIPFNTAYATAAFLETCARAMPGRPEPYLTRYTVGVLGRSQTLSIEAARRELGYVPRVSIMEGLERTAQWWRSAYA